MSDPISRQAAIDALIEWYGCEPSDLDYFKEIVEKLPSADRPQEWVPCSERLPTEEDQDDELGVLVTLGNGYSGLQYDWYHDGYWYDWNGFVVAWMPLPKPFGKTEQLGKE